MAKKKGSSDGVYRVIDVIGTSKISWEDAAKSAIAIASKSLRDLRIAEVAKLDMKVEGGKVVAYRARVQLSFKYEA
jgi:flavin-binding protein dodecin